MVRLLMLSGLILLLAALVAPTASAGVREKILRECQEGRITGSYTPKQLRDARKHIPTDIDEYSDCRDVLSQAALTGRSGGAGGGGGGGVVGSNAPGGIQPYTGQSPLTASDPVETATLNSARLKSDKQSIGKASLVPGATGLAADAARRGLPTSVLIVLILLGLCASAATFTSVRRLVLTRRQR